MVLTNFFFFSPPPSTLILIHVTDDDNKNYTREHEWTVMLSFVKKQQWKVGRQAILRVICQRQVQHVVTDDEDDNGKMELLSLCDGVDIVNVGNDEG